MKVKPYTTPPDTYDLPFTWIFDSSIFPNGSNQLNSSIYLLGGYGDFQLRRIVGLNRVLAADVTGKFQIQRASKGSYIQSDPVQAANSPELPITPEEGYLETGKIWFDLYGIAQPSSILTSQLAFQGVRRMKGNPPPQPDYKANPKSYTYVVPMTLNTSGGAPVQTVTLIQDYDFELHQLILLVKGASGFEPITNPVCLVELFDQNKISISSKPVLDIFYNGAPDSPYENGAIVPPLFYRKETPLKINFYGLGGSMLYNFASEQIIPITEQGVGAGGPYLFIGGPSPPSPSLVQVYKNDGTGNYAFLQTIPSPDGNDLLINQGCYDDTSGYLVLGGANKAYLYKLVAGLFALQSTYNPGGADSLVGGATVQISGTNVVLLGEDFTTSQLVCKYLSVSTGAFVQLQSFNQAADPGRGNYLTGGASFSGTHFVLNNTVSHSMKCFELSGGAFSLIQTIGGVQFCNVLSLGYLFTITTAATPAIDIFTFSSGSWTQTQTLNFPPFPGNPSFPSAPFSFISTTFGVPILLLTASYTGADNAIVAAYLINGEWVVYQTFDLVGPSGVVDTQGLVGAQSALILPNSSINEVIIFLGSPPPEILAYLVGKKLYPCS